MQVRVASRMILVLALLLVTLPVSADGDLLGRRPPEWNLSDWLNSAPLTLEDLQGQVVLVRWWTGPGCPFCRAAADALNGFYRRYRGDGLEIVGIYHHKAPTPLEPDRVRRYAENLGLEFPVAIDRGWRTLREWWLGQGERRWTSVSFLLDRDGVVRHIHPGGSYVAGDPDHAALREKLEELLDSPTQPVSRDESR
ncbi:MAG: TlpA disulfide reductase family protein [Thermoanaerobaculia bacterium]